MQLVLLLQHGEQTKRKQVLDREVRAGEDDEDRNVGGSGKTRVQQGRGTLGESKPPHPTEGDLEEGKQEEEQQDGGR